MGQLKLDMIVRIPLLMKQRRCEAAESMSRHSSFVSHTLKPLQYGVIAHVRRVAALPWEEPSCITGQFLQLRQRFECLPGKWHDVRSSHFHTFFRNIPPTVLKIEFRLLGSDQFSRSHEGQGEEAYGEAGGVSPWIDLDSAQQLRQLFSFNTSVVGFKSFLQHVGWTDVYRRVALGITVGNCETAYLASCFESSLRNVPSTPILNRFDHSHKLWSGDLVHKLVPEKGAMLVERRRRVESV